MAADHLFELEEIAATSRTAERRLAFARQLEGQLRAPLRLAETLAACLDGADAALLAVPTADPILDRSEVSDRLLLAVLAGDRRTRQLDREVMETVGVLVDHHEQAAASGEFRYASAQGRADRIALTRDPAGRVLDIGDAACGHLTDAGPRPRLAYLTGLAAQDLGAAALVYERICI
jgi:ornithine cyclodeaminase/alanine dehydrogenase-like protein (mu-crystallin family)